MGAAARRRRHCLRGLPALKCEAPACTQRASVCQRILRHGPPATAVHHRLLWSLSVLNLARPCPAGPACRRAPRLALAAPVRAACRCPLAGRGPAGGQRGAGSVAAGRQHGCCAGTAAGRGPLAPCLLCRAAEHGGHAQPGAVSAARYLTPRCLGSPADWVLAQKGVAPGGAMRSGSKWRQLGTACDS